MLNWRASLFILPLSCLLGCGEGEASVEDVQSAFYKSISLASEAQSFVDYVGQGRSTSSFAAGHLHYLREEVNESSQEISSLHSDSHLMNALEVDREQLRLLGEQIDQADQSLRQPSSLDNIAKQMGKIRLVLQQTSSTL